MTLCHLHFRPTINSTAYTYNTTGEYNNTVTGWINETVKWTWTVRIFAVDNGVPKRGDFIPFTVTFSASCVARAKVSVNSSGHVFFTAPGYTVSIYGMLLCYTYD